MPALIGSFISKEPPFRLNLAQGVWTKLSLPRMGRATTTRAFNPFLTKSHHQTGSSAWSAGLGRQTRSVSIHIPILMPCLGGDGPKGQNAADLEVAKLFLVASALQTLLLALIEPRNVVGHETAAKTLVVAI